MYGKSYLNYKTVLLSTVNTYISSMGRVILGLYPINQSINQFYFLLSATSSMPLALYNGTHTLV